MDSLFSKSLAMIVSMFLLIMLLITVISPQDNATQSYVASSVYEFIDKSRATGYISSSNYEEFVNHLDNTGLLYDITITHMSLQTDYIAEPTGVECYTYYENFYTDEIVDILFNTTQHTSLPYTKYALKEGDYLKVEVSNITPTLTRNIIGYLTGSQNNGTIFIAYGGYVGSNMQ